MSKSPAPIPDSKLRIAYVPYTESFTAPGDRRRLCFYGKERGLNIELYEPGKTYDLVVLSSLADLTWWSRQPREGTPKIIFDMVDSYLQIDRKELRARLRGTAKFLLRQHAHLEVSYHDSIIRMCERADAIICSTPEQRETLLPFNTNVHHILDYHSNDATAIKSEYASGPTTNIVWEGVPGNVDAFASVSEVLQRVAKTHDIALHLITDLGYKVVNGPGPLIPTRWLLDRRLPNLRTYLYEWNDLMFSSIASSCDIAIIPLLRDSPISMAKPENKLLLFWRMGLPVVAASTAAYNRATKEAGVGITCETDKEWEEALVAMIESESLRKATGTAGRTHAESKHGIPSLTAKWDTVLASVLA